MTTRLKLFSLMNYITVAVISTVGSTFWGPLVRGNSRPHVKAVYVFWKASASFALRENVRFVGRWRRAHP